MDYQFNVYNVTVVAIETSAEVSIAIFDDSIVEVKETFTAALSVPAAETALVCQLVLLMTLLMWRRKTMVSRTLYTCMSLSVHPLSPRLHPGMAYITFSDMSYQVTESSDYVTIL